MAPDPSLTPELVHARAFTVGFRGYDQSEVREFLNRVSAEIKSLREQVENLESNWRSAEERAARPPVLDEETLMAAVGEETAAILRTARASAAELRNKAADDADRIRQEADGLLAEKTKEAEEAAAVIVEAARAEAAQMLDKTRAEADQIRAKAEQDRALTIEGANSTREKILEDLSRRRRVATVQIEQLRAGRERLLESYAVVRRTLEEAHEELTRADAEARAAADEVGRKLNREPELPDLSADDLPAGASSSGESSAGGSSSGGSSSGAPSGGLPPAGPSNGGKGGAASGGSGGASVAVAAAVEHPSNRGSGEASQAASEQSGSDQSGQVPHLRVVPDLEPAGGGAGDAGTEAIVAEAGIASEEGAAGDGSPVDELFAKIRAGRGSRSAAAGNALEQRPGAAGAEAGVKAGEEAGSAAGAEATSSAGGEATATAEAAPITAGDANTEDEPAEAGQRSGDEAWLQKREEAISSLEVSLTRKLKRALQDEQNDLLDRLRGLRSEVTAEAVLPSDGSQKERYSKAALPLVAQAAGAGSKFAAGVLGGEPGEGPDVTAIAGEAADSIVGPLRRRLEQAIAVGASEDQAVLIESLGAAYREWKSQRVERIAGDALCAAFSRGTWHGAPDGTALRWIVDDVDGPCPDCDDDALAGELPKGESFPTGQAHPPAHTGCRCLLVPVKA